MQLCYGGGSLGTALVGAAAERHLAAFLEAGGTAFDTAHCYACWVPGGVGASERELGRALRALGALDRVTIATKGGHPAFGESYPRPADFLAPEVLQSDIAESCERLGVASLDRFYLHRDDGKTPVAEILDCLNQEIQAGRVRELGASNWSVARLREANQVATARGWQGFTSSQIQGSLATPTWAITADPTVRYLTNDDLSFGLPLALYSATAGGYFAGNPAANGLYDSPVNQARRERAQQLAAQRGATPTQVALAYLLHLPVPTTPIFGTTSHEHLAEVMDATALSLTAEEVLWLRG